jgi:hypothetical protein
MENAKQAYRAPELKEWGAVADITQITKCVNSECYANGSVIELSR